MTRPEYVKCIARTHAEHIGEAWCGRRISMEFHFQSLDHAAENGKNEGRLVACPECVASAVAALHNGLPLEELPSVRN